MKSKQKINKEPLCEHPDQLGVELNYCKNCLRNTSSFVKGGIWFCAKCEGVKI